MSRRVHLFVPCLADRMAAGIATSTVRCLEAAGCTVVFDPRPTCCGQTFLNSGMPALARPLARRFVRAFADADAVVMPSGSCAATVRERYGALLDGPDRDAWDGLRDRVFELSAFLAGPAGVPRWTGRFAARAVLHWSCHLPREPGPRASVETIIPSWSRRNIAGMTSTAYFTARAFFQNLPS